MQVIASTLDTDADGLLALDVIKKVTCPVHNSCCVLFVYPVLVFVQP